MPNFITLSGRQSGKATHLMHMLKQQVRKGPVTIARKNGTLATWMSRRDAVRAICQNCGFAIGVKHYA